MDLHGTPVVHQRGNHLTSGRKFKADELQLMLLWFLRDNPAYGYDLIKRFNDLSQGYYRPSPGALYPALNQLQALGYAQAEASGKRKNYQMTQAGQEHLQRYDQRTQTLIAILKHAAKKMLWISRASESEAAAAAATGWLPEFIQARGALKAALLAQSDADHVEQRRITAILQRAAKEIQQEAPSLPASSRNNLEIRDDDRTI